MNKLRGYLKEVDDGRFREPIRYIPKLFIGAVIGAVLVLDMNTTSLKLSDAPSLIATIFELVVLAVTYVFADLLGRALWLRTKHWYRARKNPLLQYTHAARVGALKLK